MLEHPSGGIPRAAKGTLNVAFSDAIIPSQSVADVTQAPIAGPLAAIRIGYKYAISDLGRIFVYIRIVSAISKIECKRFQI